MTSATATTLIQTLESNVERIQARGQQKVEKGRITQEKADQVVEEFRAEVEVAIAAIREVDENRGEEVVGCIKLSQAQTNDMAGIIALAERLMGRA